MSVLATKRRVRPIQVPPPDVPPTNWLVGPWFDLLFLANLVWPLLVLFQVGEVLIDRSELQFWQVYYITTPHRWATLLIVFLDRERFDQRRSTFLWIAAIAVLVCLGVRLTTGALTCLMAINYIWNAWHFAAQHHGIYRVYERRDGATRAIGVGWEKWALRGFVLYVALRVATVTWSDPSWDNRLAVGDWVMALVPVWFALRVMIGILNRTVGGTVYLLSVLSLYSGLLWATHERQVVLVLSLATASALFHAVEYLALVSWSVRQRYTSHHEKMGALAHMVPHWGITLAVFVIILGAGGWLMDQRFLEFWLMINLVVAFLHYAYDGLIWRRTPKVQSAS